MNISRATLFPGIDGFARSLSVGQDYARVDVQMELRLSDLMDQEEDGLSAEQTRPVKRY
jgi:hypothetical protein